MIVHVFRIGASVGLRAEPCEALLVDVDSQGTHAIYTNVYSQIVLQIIDQVRSVHIMLDNPSADPFFLSGRLNVLEYFFNLATEKDASALR